MNNGLKDIAGRFAVEGEILGIEPLGSGLINDTYKVCTSGSTPDYVLQRINNSIFKDVELLQRNIELVTDHIRKKLEQADESDIKRKVLKFIPVKDDGTKTFCVVDGQFWRMSEFIPDSYTYNIVDPEYSYQAGKAFGNFEAMLADLPQQLGETIPDFHNMELRWSQLQEAVEADRAGRMAEAESQEILSFLSIHSAEMCKAESLYRQGLLPKRICHCDSKVNNMLFDASGKVLCVIDLDTVMPSFVFSDFGDFLRTAANPVAEDSPEISKVNFRMDIFKAFTKGYLESADSFLSPVEKEMLPYGALLFPFMQAVRFFADYINGDTYYKISYPLHNLVRTRNQIALFKSALEQKSEMESFIESIKK